MTPARLDKFCVPLRTNLTLFIDQEAKITEQSIRVLLHAAINAFKKAAYQYDGLIERKQQEQLALQQALFVLQTEYEEYKVNRKQHEAAWKVTFQAEHCELNLQDCRRQTERLTNEADESNVHDRSLHEDVVERLGTDGDYRRRSAISESPFNNVWSKIKQNTQE